MNFNSHIQDSSQNHQAFTLDNLSFPLNSEFALGLKPPVYLCFNQLSKLLLVEVGLGRGEGVVKYSRIGGKNTSSPLWCIHRDLVDSNSRRLYLCCIPCSFAISAFSCTDSVAVNWPQSGFYLVNITVVFF